MTVVISTMSTLPVRLPRMLLALSFVVSSVLSAAAQATTPPSSPPPTTQPAPSTNQQPEIDPESGPHGDWNWAAQASFGLTFQGGSSSETVKFGPAPVATLGVVRALTCHVEVFGAGVLPIKQSIEVSGQDGDIAPTGFQAGFTFKTCQRPGGDFYGGVFVGGYTRDRSQPLTVDGRTQTFTFPGGAGTGFSAGYRRIVNRTMAFDAGMKWQRLRAVFGDDDLLAWNPLSVNVSVLFRF